MDVIKKYAPACIFHENEQNYPCSVEFLLKGATLKWRTWTFASQCKDNQSPAVTQETGIPALALFKSDIWMVYTDSHSSQLLVTKSGDGVTWDEARQIPGQHTSVPAVAVFLNKLWIVYTDAHSAQVSNCHKNDISAISQFQSMDNYANNINSFGYLVHPMAGTGRQRERSMVKRQAFQPSQYLKTSSTWYIALTTAANCTTPNQTMAGIGATLARLMAKGLMYPL